MFGEVWFTALPDSDAATHVARVLSARGIQQIAHPSGRPWLVGRWPDGRITLGRHGHAAVAVVGRTSATSGELTGRAAELRDVGELTALAKTLRGSACVLASVGGQVRAQGSVSGVQRIFHANFAGVAVASDRADTLAALLGEHVDDGRLALRLLCPTVTHPLEELPLWRSVRAVPAGSYLRITSGGHASEVSWWTPPAPTLSLADGAPAVRQALTEAVDTCAAPGGTLSCDLSGGLDSTSVAFLASRGPAALVTTRWQELDPANDDSRWARIAISELPAARHLVLGGDAGPPWFEGVAEPAAPTEEPYRWGRGRAWATRLAERMAAEGSRLHLGGHGGDELAICMGGYLHGLTRRHPLAGLRRTQAHRALGRWPVGLTLRALADRRDFRRWLAASADELTRPPAHLRTPSIGWADDPRLPPWATPAAVEAVRAEISDALARGVGPLGPRRGEHQSLELIRTGALIVRQVDEAMRQAGLPMAAPLLDDRVVEAALAVRLHERMTPLRFKPLLTEAMRGVVPDVLLGRSTKGEFTYEVYAAFRRRRAELLSLLDGSLLAERGLIDADALRAALLAPHPNSTTLRPIEPTIACECWLRSLPAADVAPAATSTGGSR